MAAAAPENLPIPNEVPSPSSSSSSSQVSSSSSTSGSSSSLLSPSTSSGVPSAINTAGLNSTLASKTPVPTDNAPRHGLPPGSAAGLAIGLLVLGFLLGAAAAFFFFRRRQAPRRVGKPAPPAAAQSPRALAIKSTERDYVDLNHFLLSATPEREMVSELSSIRNLLEAHVEEHYHLQPVRCDVALLTNAVSNLGLGRRGSLSPAEATSLALNPQTRYATLRHILSEVIFNSASLRGQCPISILPAPMAMFAKSIPPVESKLGNAEATLLALTKWRTISTFLLSPCRSDRSPLQVDKVASAGQVDALAISLNGFLEPFITPDPSSRLQQVEHLKAVILEIAKLGYVILSQPSEWEFSHREDLRGQGTFVFSPGLAKTRDREGRAYQPPKNVADAVVVHM